MAKVIRIKATKRKGFHSYDPRKNYTLKEQDEMSQSVWEIWMLARDKFKEREKEEKRREGKEKKTKCT